MATIDIIVAINAGEIVNQIAAGKLSAGTQAKPTNLGAWKSSDVFIVMVSENQYATDDQGGSELTVNASFGDTINWSMTTFGRDIDHTAYIYDSSFNPNTALEDITYNRISKTPYLPAGTDPTVAPTVVDNQVVYQAQAAVIAKSEIKVQYSMTFAVYDNATGDAVGFFMWDPFINVNPS